MANTLAAVEAGATPGAGHDERRRRAHRQRQPRRRSSPTCSSRWAIEVRRARAARPADRDRALRRRAAQPHARPATSPTWARTPSPTRAACTSPACAPTPRPSSTSSPAQVGNRRELLVSELAGRAHRRREGRRGRASSVDDAAAARVVERVKELEHAGYQFEAADGSFELLLRKETGDYEPLFRLESWRVIVEQRADGKVETEATIKIWVDGERYVRTAEGNGPVNALDAALRDAIGEIHPHLRGHRARQLQGPHPRREPRHRTRSRACCIDASDGQRRLGLDRRRRERHRRLLAGARRLAGVRRAAGAPRARRRAERERSDARRDPARPARPRRRGGGRGARGAALRPALARPARARPSSRRFAARLGAAHASAVSSGTAGPAPRAARGRASATATRSSPRRSRSWPAPTRSSTSARGRCSPTSTRVTLNLDPRRRGRRGDRAHDARCCRSTSSATPPTCPALRAPRACRSSRTPARRSAPCTPTASPVGARGHPAVFGFYANKQLTTGEGGMVTMGDAADQGAHRLRAQPGPRARHGLARPRPPRLQLPPQRHRVRDRARPARAPRRHARRPRPRRRAGTARRWPASRASACRARTPAATPRLVRLRRPGAARARSRRRRSARCASAACRASPTCRRST